IAPNMATMLGFFATDACIDQAVLEDMLSRATENSFNRISVDSDTSTNDAVTLSATSQSAAKHLSDIDSASSQVFYAELESLMIELATSIVRDGEGASKFIKIEVTDGLCATDCQAVAEAVANSPFATAARVRQGSGTWTGAQTGP
ncbi:MAG: bifunctional ornithine acetyltransferase/N-acetylglutamate synthase, partial [Verrucomicrobiota bacterium]